jgi:hypothetical protein
MNSFVKSAWVVILLLLVFCPQTKAADELIAEHVFATIGNINAVTYNSGTPEEVMITCTNGSYSSGAFQVSSGAITSSSAQYVQVSIPSPAVTISKVEFSAYTSNTRKTFYMTSGNGTSWGSSGTQVTLSKSDAAYAAVNSAVSGPLYVRIGGLTGGSGTVSITAIRVYAAPSAPSLALTSAAGTNNQSVPENLEIRDIVYTYGGTAGGYAIVWENTTGAAEPPAGIEVTANSAARTATISGKPVAQGVYAYTIKATEAGLPADATTLTGTITVTEPVPVLSASPVSLSAFNYLAGEGGPSAAQSFTLAGANLIPGEISISAPDNYEVSTDNAAFGASATLVATGAVLEATPVYVRLKAELETGNYNGTVTMAGAGVSEPVAVALNGSVTTPLELVPVTSKTWTHADFVSGTYAGAIDPVFSADKTLKLTAGVDTQGNTKTIYINDSSVPNSVGKIRMHNSGSTAWCNLSFKVTGASKITITAESSNDNAREIAVATASGMVGTVSAPGRNNAAALSVNYDGNDPEGIIYIYSNGGGAIDITSIAVEPAKTAISSPDVSKTTVSETYYTLTGERLSKTNNTGVYIRKTIYADGSVETSKILKK